MKAIKTEIKIKAPKKLIWKMLTRLEDYAQWNPFILKAKGSVKLGERIQILVAPSGSKPSVFKPKIVEYDEGKRFAWYGSVIVPGIFDGKHKFELIEDDDYCVVLKHDEVFSGLLSNWILKKIQANVHLGFNTMNLALKQHCESLAKSQPNS